MDLFPHRSFNFVLIVISVIIGTTNVEHLYDNLKTLDNLDFSQDEIDAIDKLIK